MKEYIGIMMTSRGCGHCAHSRGNGIMGSGPHFMKPSTVDEFLSISDNMLLLNIHFESMAGKRNLVREISKFSKTGDVITQNYWTIEQDNQVSLHIVEANTATKSIKQTHVDVLKDNNGEPIIWDKFINMKIPKNIENYTYYYPCFMIAKTENWKDAIENDAELYAITNAGKTRKDKSGKVFLDRDGKSFNERMVEPKKLFSDITSGKEKLVPHIIDTEPPKKKEEVKPKIKQQEVKKSVNYVIEQY